MLWHERGVPDDRGIIRPAEQVRRKMNRLADFVIGLEPKNLGALIYEKCSVVFHNLGLIFVFTIFCC